MNPNSCTDLSAISLNEQTNFRLNEINKIKDYFESELKEREAVIKKLSKYITGFDYTEKILIALSTTFSGVSIFSHLNIKKTHRYNKFCSCFVVSRSKTVIKKLLYETKKKKRKNIARFLIWVK